MIVKNEAHIVREALEACAPHVHYWVIVDTGSIDGTQDVIRTRMAELGIPGELHERPWRDFGSNRTEALRLAQGHSDYIWVMDADDTVEGRPDFSALSVDGYEMRVTAESSWWRLQLFKDGVDWRYVGVLHEYAVCDEPTTTARLPGDYRIIGRYLGGRTLAGNKLEGDRDLMLAELQRDPSNPFLTFCLAGTFALLGDHDNARTWCERRVDMGGRAEEVYFCLRTLAKSLEQLGEPWSVVQDAYLRAWEFRPSRAEALTAIAQHYRMTGQYETGYLFASRAAQIPYPESDSLFIDESVHRWQALDEQAVCASWIGRQNESVRIWSGLLDRAEIDMPDHDRNRILTNRDFVAAQLAEGSSAYPAELIRPRPGPRDALLTVSLTAGADVTAAEKTLNSFLQCCTDSALVGRFLIADDGLSGSDRANLADRYPFLEFTDGADLATIRAQVAGPYWLHLWQGWRFFSGESLLTRLISVLDADPEVFQVGINADRANMSEVRTVPGRGTYLITRRATLGPAMFDVGRLDRALAGSATPALTATLDGVFCLTP